MNADYTSNIGKDINCPCYQLNIGTKRGASQGCPLCHGKLRIDRDLYQRFYDRFVLELQGSGEFDTSQPPTLPIREQPMRLHEILAPNGSLLTSRVAMQTAGHVTYWVCPKEDEAGMFYLSARPYAPEPIYFKKGTIADIELYIPHNVHPHPHSIGWLAREKEDVNHAR